MKCPSCAEFPSYVTQTTRPLDEGLGHGMVKRRLRKCRKCSNNFQTFEVHEDDFRKLFQNKSPARHPLIVEERKTSVIKESLDNYKTRKARKTKPKKADK